MWIPRAVEPRLERSAKTRPVVVLTGARQTGKTSTFLRLFPKHAFVSVDLPAEAEQAVGGLGAIDRALGIASVATMIARWRRQGWMSHDGVGNYRLLRRCNCARNCRNSVLSIATKRNGCKPIGADEQGLSSSAIASTDPMSVEKSSSTTAPELNGLST
jgi:hypothetical protein